MVELERLIKTTGIFVFFLFTFPLVALEKREVPVHFTTTVIIPCHGNHVRFLPDLIQSYTEQTTLPDEIVISISGMNQSHEKTLKKIQTHLWPFRVLLYTYPEQKNPGANRNTCVFYSHGDLIICQDADDMPHPQRLAMIKYFFETYPITHLMHNVCCSAEKFVYFPNFENVTYLHSPTYTQQHADGKVGANGVCAFKREIWDHFQWDESKRFGEDVVFNSQIYDQYPSNITLDASIYAYRRQYSLSKEKNSLLP